jgi:hypothetical protein
LVRTYPVRAEAWEVLQKRNQGLPPGFLNSGLTFHRTDALVWDPSGTLRVRIDSDDPANDVPRLGALLEAFDHQAQARNQRRDDNRRQLADVQQQQLELLKKDAELKARIDESLPAAQRYMDLKAALQATQRYLELADDSNPLRLVARQNLGRLTAQVTDARGIAIERDDDLAARVGVQKGIDEATTTAARLRKEIETFAYPEPPDMKAIRVFDTRAHRTAMMNGAWVGLILLFGGTVAFLRYQDRPQRLQERWTRRQGEGTIVSRRRGHNDQAHKL